MRLILAIPQLITVVHQYLHRSFSAHHQRLAKQAKKKRIKESKIGAGGPPDKDGGGKGGGGGDSTKDRGSMKKGKGKGPKPKMTKEERRAKYTEKCGFSWACCLHERCYLIVLLCTSDEHCHMTLKGSPRLYVPPSEVFTTPTATSLTASELLSIWMLPL